MYCMSTVIFIDQLELFRPYKDALTCLVDGHLDQLYQGLEMAISAEESYGKPESYLLLAFLHSREDGKTVMANLQTITICRVVVWN